MFMPLIQLYRPTNVFIAVKFVVIIFSCFYNTFISNARLKLTKNQANAKEHPEAELLLLENYSNSSSKLSSKDNRTYSKK